MMLIAGAPFLTDFQRTRLLQEFQQQTNLNLTSLTTQQIFVLSDTLTDEALDKAKKLLGVHDDIELNPAEQGELQVIVCPRFGTISPWSSKATDIFNNCGLKVERVERAVVFTLAGEDLTETLPKEASDCMTA